MTGACAPVATWSLAVAGDRVVGHAAPAGGPSPCLLRLEAGGEAIAFARAARFAADAGGLRAGWCGLSLPGAALAGALADRFQVRCAVSGRLLFDAAAPPPVASPARSSLFDLLHHARADDRCDDPLHILPFARASHRAGGVAGLLGAAYRNLLRRDPDPLIVARWQDAPPADPPSRALDMILTSAEYRDQPGRFIPGPFHPAFAFDRSPLEG